jgi:hypothetical protein
MKKLIVLILCVISFGLPAVAWPDWTCKSLTFQTVFESVNSKLYPGFGMQYGLNDFYAIKPAIEVNMIQFDQNWGYYDYAWPVMLNLRWEMPALPYYAGVSGGILFHSNDLHPEDNAKASLISGVFAGMNILKGIAPFSAYVQAGVENATINYTTAGNPFSYKFGGITLKAGATFGY